MSTATAFTPTYTKYIGYDRLTKDYAAYFDGEVIGFYASHHEAEVALDKHVADIQASGLTRSATELDSGAPEWETEPTSEWDCPICAEINHMCPACVQDAKGGALDAPICTFHGCTRPATRAGLIPGLPVCDEHERTVFEHIYRRIFEDSPELDGEPSEPAPPWDDGEEDNWGGFRAPRPPVAPNGIMPVAGAVSIGPVRSRRDAERIAPTPAPTAPTDAGMAPTAVPAAPHTENSPSAPPTVALCPTECARCGAVQPCYAYEGEMLCLDSAACNERANTWTDADYEEERDGTLVALAQGIAACTICSGPHHPQRCPKIGALLMRDPHALTELPKLRSAFRTAMASGHHTAAYALLADAACLAEAYVSCAGEPMAAHVVVEA